MSWGSVLKPPWSIEPVAVNVSQFLDYVFVNHIETALENAAPTTRLAKFTRKDICILSVTPGNEKQTVISPKVVTVVLNNVTTNTGRA
ncbi:hypothetical protein FHG87_000644 [Trinorchestia longiramus]|nr:hypothetical protein FHG87_000644 [Trinorchestia longiramus]